MTKQAIVGPGINKPHGAYSPGLLVGDWVFVSGQGPYDPVTGALIGETIEEQTRQTLENIAGILAAGGASMADVVKSTVHLADLSMFSAYNAVYSTYFPDPKPVRTTVGSQLLGILVEIDVIAYIGS
jgi:2-iminobutanoate/2-iminopropanoate deaminase